MGLIPFVLDKTVVTSSDAFDRNGGRNGRAVLIKAFDSLQLHEEGASNATYDLRVGRKYRDHRDEGQTELENDETIPLRPGAAVIIQAEEEVHFPNKIFGQIVPKVSLLQKGVSNTSSKIDPGYNGVLLITVFNLGRKAHTFKRGDRFCNLYLLGVEDGIQPYDKLGQSLPGAAGRGIWRRIRDLAVRNKDLTNIYVVGVSAIVALLVNVILMLISHIGIAGQPRLTSQTSHPTVASTPKRP